MKYRYYLTQRPPQPGTFPGKAKTIEAFDSREIVSNVGMAWGYVEYDKPLTSQQEADYELKRDLTE